MRYADVVAATFHPSLPGAVAGPTAGASRARRLRDAVEPIAMHAVWSPTVNRRLEALGLDFLTGYVWGRAAALGDPSPGTVAATFAVFEPGFLRATYEGGRAACGRAAVLDARASAAGSLGAVLADEEVGEAADRLRRAVEGADGAGRPLFSGLRDLPWPERPVGVLWRACELVREHRGDGHVAACVAAGLDAVDANVLTELWVGFPLGTYTATRGWSPDAVGTAADGLRRRGLLDGDLLSPAGRAFRQDLEDATDASTSSLVDALDGDVDGLLVDLERWSARCVEAGAFPPDVHKRAAG